MYIHTCLNCQKDFSTKRSHAVTCSDRCRMALKRRRQKLKLYTVEALPPQARQMLEELKTVALKAYNRIMWVLKTQGSGVAEQAIYAAYEAADDCITFLSRPISK